MKLKINKKPRRKFLSKRKLESKFRRRLKKSAKMGPILKRQFDLLCSS